MEPLYLGDVPKGPGTPHYYCTVSCNEKPYRLLNMYGSQSLFADAQVWHEWLVVGFGCFVYFISLDTEHQQSFFDLEYYCSLYPTEKYMLVTSLWKVYSFNQTAHLNWESGELSADGVSISSIRGDEIIGMAECPPCYDPLGRGEFKLSLHSGRLISMGMKTAYTESPAHS